MSVDRDDKRLRFMPIDTAIVPPPGLLEHLNNRYWVCDKERGLVFWKPHKSSGLYPQCNQSRDITEKMAKRLYPWAEVKHMKSVFRKINPHDY